MATGASPRPYLLVVETTHRCNARCSYCDSWRTPTTERKHELTTDEHKRLLDDAFELGVRMVSYSGGEPLLHEGFLEIARHARALGMRAAVNTNGYLVTPEVAAELVQALDSITVSIDSPSADVMRARRGSPTALKRARAGLANLVAARRHPHQIRVEAVVDERNAADLDELAADLAADEVPLLLQPLHRDGIFADNPNGSEREDSIAKDDTYTRFAGPRANLSRSEAAYVRPFYDGIAEHLAGQPRWFRCYAGSFAFHVTPRGDVIVCQTQRRSMGNLRERSLAQIWESMAETRRAVSSDERSCNCWLMCSTVNYLQADRLDRTLCRAGGRKVNSLWNRLAGDQGREAPTR